MGSAPLAPLSLVGPGFAGLNKQTASNILGPEWAVEAQNCVFDDANRLSSRNGWTSITSTPIGGTPNLEQVHEYTNLSGTNIIVSAGNNNIYSGTTAPSSITGAVSISANNWKFQNFNGNVYGLQNSHALIFWNGAGNFANVTAASGTVPDGNTILSAFGRLWGTSANGQTLKFSALLDATHWTTGAGSWNFTSVWATGYDSIVAVAAFNNSLIVFGSRNIIIIQDGTGSVLGLDPTNAEVIDVIPGIGCISRDTVQNINGDDLAFLSAVGVTTLRRVIEEKGNPLRDASKNVRDYIMGMANTGTLSRLRSTFNPAEGFYLLLIPDSTRFFCFDTKEILPDGTWRVTEWTGFTPRSLTTLKDNMTTYVGHLGRIFSYSGYLDNGATYRFIYNSGWLNLGPEVADRLKILKKIASIVYIAGTASIITKWAFDFSNTFSSFTRTTTATGTGGEWGTGEWGTSEFSGTLGLREIEVPTNGMGQFVKVGIECDINSAQLALQNTQLFAKIGRMT